MEIVRHTILCTPPGLESETVDALLSLMACSSSINQGYIACKKGVTCLQCRTIDVQVRWGVPYATRKSHPACAAADANVCGSVSRRRVEPEL